MRVRDTACGGENASVFATVLSDNVKPRTSNKQPPSAPKKGGHKGTPAAAAGGAEKTPARKAATPSTSVPKRGETRTCHRCGKAGHLQHYCTAVLPEADTAALTTTVGEEDPEDAEYDSDGNFIGVTLVDGAEEHDDWEDNFVGVTLMSAEVYTPREC